MFRQKQSLTGEELRRRESVVLTAAAKENQLNGFNTAITFGKLSML